MFAGNGSERECAGTPHQFTILWIIRIFGYKWISNDIFYYCILLLLCFAFCSYISASITYTREYLHKLWSRRLLLLWLHVSCLWRHMQTASRAHSWTEFPKSHMHKHMYMNIENGEKKSVAPLPLGVTTSARVKWCVLRIDDIRQPHSNFQQHQYK